VRDVPLSPYDILPSIMGTDILEMSSASIFLDEDPEYAVSQVV